MQMGRPRSANGTHRGDQPNARVAEAGECGVSPLPANDSRHACQCIDFLAEQRRRDTVRPSHIHGHAETAHARTRSDLERTRTASTLAKAHVTSGEWVYLGVERAQSAHVCWVQLSLRALEVQLARSCAAQEAGSSAPTSTSL